MVCDPRVWRRLGVVCTNNGIAMGWVVGDPRVWSRLAIGCANNRIAMDFNPFARGVWL
jgi:hypothetical protein